MQIMRVLWFTALLVVAALGLTSASDLRPGTSVATLGDGVHAFSVSNPAGLRVVVHVRADLNAEFEPIVMFFAQEDGTVRTVFEEGFGDSTQWGQGSGVVYARALGMDVRSPSLAAAPYSNNYWDSIVFNATRGTLFLAWANRDNGEVYLEWPAGTTIVHSLRGDATSFEAADVAPVGSGVGPAVRVDTRGSILTQPAAGGAFVYEKYRRSDIAGRGHLSIQAETARLEVDLSTSPDPFDECICYAEGRIFAQSTSGITTTWRYAGEGRETDLKAVAFTLPADYLTAPEAIWHHTTR